MASEFSKQCSKEIENFSKIKFDKYEKLLDHVEELSPEKPENSLKKYMFLRSLFYEVYLKKWENKETPLPTEDKKEFQKLLIWKKAEKKFGPESLGSFLFENYAQCNFNWFLSERISCFEVVAISTCFHILDVVASLSNSKIAQILFHLNQKGMLIFDEELKEEYCAKSKILPSPIAQSIYIFILHSLIYCSSDGLSTLNHHQEIAKSLLEVPEVPEVPNEDEGNLKNNDLTESEMKKLLKYHLFEKSRPPKAPMKGNVETLFNFLSLNYPDGFL